MSIFALRSNGLASSAYKNLSRAQTSLTDNISRLASGLRINKTADDSAGSNVSVRMGNQVSGMAQANRNAQDTNNLLATAESGLSDISDILGKMRELSVQASTDTLNDVDRASINLEFQALKDELTRISNVTEYNGMNVLNGSYQSDDGRGQWRIQIGADNDVNNQHQFSLMDATATGLGLQDSTSSLEVTSSSNVTFTDSGQSLGSSKSMKVSLGDVDDDGDLDAFVTNQLRQGNKVYINDGNGTFTDSGQSLGS
ncbi:MAG: FG-GAP-like repeat-containing protein, partial [Anaerolineales bacterium]|nr:FG-GAP-like repeat-containing protein [Anaerolineales bacterium]